MEDIEKPNYFAIIPANVRYDERLSDKEKLLYGEITSLSNKEGYCWASNSYFASLYKASIKTISRGINNLKECGYFDIELQYRKNSKEVEKRIIKLKSYPMDKNVYTYGQNFPYPMDKNVQDNNTSINTINEYIIDLTKYDVDNESEFKQIIQEWIEYKKDKKQSYKSQQSLNILIKKLINLSDGKYILAREIVENSIANNYSGIFELKNKSSRNSSSCQCEYSLEQDWDKEAFEGVYEYGD